MTEIDQPDEPTDAKPFGFGSCQINAGDAFIDGDELLLTNSAAPAFYGETSIAWSVFPRSRRLPWTQRYQIAFYFIGTAFGLPDIIEIRDNAFHLTAPNYVTGLDIAKFIAGGASTITNPGGGTTSGGAIEPANSITTTRLTNVRFKLQETSPLRNGFIAVILSSRYEFEQRPELTPNYHSRDSLIHTCYQIRVGAGVAALPLPGGGSGGGGTPGGGTTPEPNGCHCVWNGREPAPDNWTKRRC